MEDHKVFFCPLKPKGSTVRIKRDVSHNNVRIICENAATQFKKYLLQFTLRHLIYDY